MGRRPAVAILHLVTGVALAAATLLNHFAGWKQCFFIRSLFV